MPIEGLDYFIRVIPFPVSIPAFLRLNPDGTYSIYLNANMSIDSQRKGLKHELDHIVNGDVYSDEDILDIEPHLGMYI